MAFALIVSAAPLSFAWAEEGAIDLGAAFAYDEVQAGAQEGLVADIGMAIAPDTASSATTSDHYVDLGIAVAPDLTIGAPEEEAPQIRVEAPLYVTFGRTNAVEAAPDTEEDQPGDYYYKVQDLEWQTGENDPATRVLESSGKTFRNFTGRDVYVSAISCMDKGASSLFPGGKTGEAVFELRGYTSSGTQTKGSIPFGYEGGSRNVSVSFEDEEHRVVLAGDEDGTEEGTPTNLKFALDKERAQFSKSALAMGSTGEDERFRWPLAYVKFTYDLAPRGGKA